MADNIKIVISAEDQASGPINNVTAALGKAGGGFSDVQAGLVTLNQTLEIARKAWEGIKIAVEAAAKITEATDTFVKLDLALRTLTGTSASAKASMAWILDFAQSAPVDIDAVSKSFIQLKAAGIDPTTGSMRALLDATLASGGGTEQFKRAIVAVQQMAGKGVISMEELRQQLAEAIPGASQIMARELGLSLPALFDKISRGALTANEGLTALFRGLEKTYGGFAASQMNTYSGQVAILTTNWQLLLAEMGRGGIYDLVVSGLRKINDVLKEMTAEAERTRLLNDVLRLGAGGMKLLNEISEQGYVPLDKLRKLHAELTYDMVLERQEAEKMSAQIVADNVLRDVQDKKARDLAGALAVVGRAWEDERIALAATSQAMTDMQDIVLDLSDSWTDWGDLIDVTIPALDDYVSELERANQQARDLAGALAIAGQSLIDAAWVQEVKTTWGGIFEFIFAGLGRIGHVVGEGLSSAIASAASAYSAAGGGLGGVGAAIGSVEESIAGGISSGSVQGAIAEALMSLLAKSPEFMKNMSAIMDALVELVAPIAEAIAPLMHALVPLIRSLVPLIQLVMQVLHPVLQVLQVLVVGITTYNNLLNILFDWLRSLIDTIANWDPFSGGSGGPNVPNTSEMAGTPHDPLVADSGGYITASDGLPLDATHRWIGAAIGERFIMPGQAGYGGGMQLTVNIRESVDSRNTASAVLRAVEELVATGRLRLA